MSDSIAAETLTDTDKTLVETVSTMLNKYRPILQSEGGDADLLSIKNGVATIRMVDSGCSGCGSTPMSTLEPGIRSTLLEKIEGLMDIVFVR